VFDLVIVKPRMRGSRCCRHGRTELNHRRSSMKRSAAARVAGVCLFFVAIVCAPLTVRAEEPMPASLPRDPALEQAIAQKLAAINPQAVPIFNAATQALDAADYKAAKNGYLRVLELAPDFPAVLRRLSYVESSLDEHDAAIQHSATALKIEPSSDNEGAYARALAATGDTQYKDAALSHARAALAPNPDDLYANVALLYVGIAYTDWTALREATDKLLKLAPNYPVAHFFAGIFAADRGDWLDAESEMLRARELGMPPKVVDKALNSGIADEARYQKIVIGGIATVAGWLLGFVVLFAAGGLLSRVTLAAVRRSRPDAATGGNAPLKPAERLLRLVYRAVIAVASVYFYISIPFVVLITLAAAGLVLYAVLQLGRVPVYLVAAVVVGAGYTLCAVVTSLAARAKQEEPGRQLSENEAPQLWELARLVAARVGTRPVDTIYVTPYAGIAVTERGPLLKRLRNAGQRCLILGLGSLPEMTQAEFRSILAHEYGHFTNRDTAGGDMALRVRNSIHTLGQRLAMSGQARWYNPAWLFVNGYYRIFLRITLGASRLQEIEADRCAAAAYGAPAFEAGLMRVVRQDAAFESIATRQIRRTVEHNYVCSNLYDVDPAERVLPADFETRLQKIVDEPTSPYDSHPGIRERFTLAGVAAGPVPCPPGESAGTQPVWDLFADAGQLQRELTAGLIKAARASYSRSRSA
jgi:Zn-dependent protease with chaperone function